MKVLEYHPPEELSQILKDFLDPNTRSTSADIETTLQKYCVDTKSPRFMCQLFNASDTYADTLLSMFNTAPYTYEIAPVFTLVEQRIIQELTMLFFGTCERSSGIFCPGGSASNTNAIHLARLWKFPHTRTDGCTQKLALFISKNAHYSFDKAAMLLGIGLNAVYHVPVDVDGRMKPSDLVSSIEQATRDGRSPFLVAATLGTTTLGAFDPLPKLREICDDYGLWLHADAAWGGMAIFTPQLAHLINGIHTVDSLTFNAHKGMLISQQCSVLLLNNHGQLLEKNHIKAAYLYNDKPYPAQYDLGQYYLQCGRRADAFKLWFAWKLYGLNYYRQIVETNITNRDYLVQKIHEHPYLNLVHEPMYLNVCFTISTGVNIVQIKKKMMERGNFLIANTDGYFRIALVKPVEKEILDQALNEILECSLESSSSVLLR
uniref:Pyridoxal-dependent decarboxylase domain protein n=1 Tax=Marseillevirus LCMAC202 TaxID=2506606 RepID=A0A481YX17_9VIRU|nr:MAG: pyridoxal-dependent decarboxylase domain protein [Marseillevirus LCMAC202]